MPDMDKLGNYYKRYVRQANWILKRTLIEALVTWSLVPFLSFTTSFHVESDG